MAMRWLKWAAVGLVTVVAGVAVAGWVWAQRTLPQTEGVMTLAGAPAGLRIERDLHGIPTIHAPTLQAAAYGLGVAHAQDRLWQMETQRRIGAGRVAEAFGPAALETDRFLRALGVRRAAAAQWAALAEEPKALLQAYAAGVNAVIATLKARPPEYLILGLQPEPWDPVDSLAWGIMMAWDLGGNWNTELLRLRLSLQMPVDRINQLLPPYPGREPLPTADYAALFRGLGLGAAPARTAARTAAGTAAGTAAAPARAGGEPESQDVASAWYGLTQTAPPSGIEGVGSNNWVVAGSHSATGQPLLANDPHLKLSAPALWYLARLVVAADVGGTGELKAAGATLPGLPVVVLGQTQHIAWGFTNTGPDVQDLYIEEVDPADRGRYRTPDGWARFETVAEVIKVKGAADVPITVRRSRHGPVISDAGTGDDVLGTTGGARYVLALRWTALDTDAESISAGLGYMRARSVADYVAASRAWVAPMQSMVVADRSGSGGRIAMIAPGRVPLRRPDNDLQGLVPAPGWDARYDWVGWVPTDETPREFDPPRGWIATANQRIVGDDYPHYLGDEWALPYRQQRIEQLLGAKRQHSLDDLARIQADERSLAVPVLLPWLQRAESAHPLAAAARQALQGFDGQMAAESAAPLIFWAWQRQLSRGLFADDAGALFDKSLAGRSFNDALEVVLARDDAHWCDDRGTPEAETCAQQAGAALTRALDDLQARFGSDVSRWRWGEAHIARSEHRPFSNVGALARFFELRTPVGGDTYTVNVSRVGLRPDRRTGELFLDEHGPSLRALYDLSDPMQSRVMHSTGQSGNPFSPLYRSFVQPWREVAYVPLWSDPAAGPTQVLQIRAP